MAAPAVAPWTVTVGSNGATSTMAHPSQVVHIPIQVTPIVPAAPDAAAPRADAPVDRVPTPAPVQDEAITNTGDMSTNERNEIPAGQAPSIRDLPPHPAAVVIATANLSEGGEAVALSLATLANAGRPALRSQATIAYSNPAHCPLTTDDLTDDLIDNHPITRAPRGSYHRPCSWAPRGFTIGLAPTSTALSHRELGAKHYQNITTYLNITA